MDALCFCGLCLACAPAPEPVATTRTMTVRTTAALSRHVLIAGRKAGARMSVTPISGDTTAASRLVQVAIEREPTSVARLCLALQRRGAGLRSMTERLAVSELEASILSALTQREAA